MVTLCSNYHFGYVATIATGYHLVWYFTHSKQSIQSSSPLREPNLGPLLVHV